MNHLVEDIIKAAKMSSKEEQAKTLILSQLLDKTEYLIGAIQTPQRELDLILDQQRRYIMSEVEDRIYRMEMEIFDRLMSFNNKRAKLIVLDGGDGCGKNTQTLKLVERLQAEGKKVKYLTFPDYNKDTSVFVKKYLNGDFGDRESVKPQVASLFFALDRYATIQEWKSIFEDPDMIVVCDRYVTSNMLYQMVRYENNDQQLAFLRWLETTEYDLLDLPTPDIVLFLTLPLYVRKDMLLNRLGKTGGSTGDIHERDMDYLRQIDDAQYKLINKFNMIGIDCSNEDTVKSIDEIHELIYNTLQEKGMI